MKINYETAIAITALIIGIIFDKQYLWIPISVLPAGIIALFTQGWVLSNRIGEAQTLSITLKSICTIINFYAMIGSIVCTGLIVYWFIF